MTQAYETYLELLRTLTKALASLSAVEQEKTAAVRQDDLIGLDDCMKREQVLCLSLRSMEKRRADALEALGLQALPLSQLAAHYPEALQLEAKNTSEALLRQYEVYKSAAQVARSTLECNLHEIDKVVAQAAPSGGAGSAGGAPALSGNLRTDFRA